MPTSALTKPCVMPMTSGLAARLLGNSYPSPVSKTPPEVIENMQRQEFLELLYQRRGRNDGLFTGLYTEWAQIILDWKRSQELKGD